MKRSLLCVAAATVLGLWLTPGVRSADDEQRGNVDQHFVMMASAANLAEINMGTMGARMASSPDVKKFAQRMVADHTKAGRQMNKLADRAGFRPATAMDERHRALAEKMAALNGPAFDRQFMQQMVKDHEMAISLFQKEAKDGKDKDLKAFAEETLPTLKEHLKMARDLAGDRGDRNERSRDESK